MNCGDLLGIGAQLQERVDLGNARQLCVVWLEGVTPQIRRSVSRYEEVGTTNPTQVTIALEKRWLVKRVWSTSERLCYGLGTLLDFTC